MIAQGLDPKDPKQDNANYLALVTEVARYDIYL